MMQVGETCLNHYSIWLLRCFFTVEVLLSVCRPSFMDMVSAQNFRSKSMLMQLKRIMIKVGRTHVLTLVITRLGLRPCFFAAEVFSWSFSMWTLLHVSRQNDSLACICVSVYVCAYLCIYACACIYVYVNRNFVVEKCWRSLSDQWYRQGKLVSLSQFLIASAASMLFCREVLHTLHPCIGAYVYACAHIHVCICVLYKPERSMMIQYTFFDTAPAYRLYDVGRKALMSHIHYYSLGFGYLHKYPPWLFSAFIYHEILHTSHMWEHMHVCMRHVRIRMVHIYVTVGSVSYQWCK